MRGDSRLTLTQTGTNNEHSGFESEMTLQPHAQDSAGLAPCEGLEEVCASSVRDMAGALVFALLRLAEADERPVLMAASRSWQGENGRPYGPGFRGGGVGKRSRGLVLAAVATEMEALWVMEQALRSGAVSAVLGTVEGASLAQSRRLEFAARDGAAAGVLLRRTQGGLTAARRRWRITTLASFGASRDDRAPGGFRLDAELVRSRTERPGVWRLEQDDETHRLRLADRLAGDGLGERGRTGLAA
jgi:protein ImuA